ncbi:MAG: hypothetical protein D6701_06290 [Gemmatimonadetes bacterium]|nr:MAG: hypothetical protein D6701_06290 [Gemmatimonadota bacterium]
MRLTVEEHSEAVRRYAHVGRARGLGARACGAPLPATGRRCSRDRGHGGPHVAHGRFGRVLAVWDRSAVTRTPDRIATSEELRASRRPTRRKKAPARPTSAASSSREAGLARRVGAWVRAHVSSFEEALFLVMFLAFAVFAVQWALLLLP